MSIEIIGVSRPSIGSRRSAMSISKWKPANLSRCSGQAAAAKTTLFFAVIAGNGAA